MRADKVMTAFGQRSKRSIVHEPNCERTPRQGTAKSVRELQRRASPERGGCCIPINLPHVGGRVGSYVGRSRLRNDSTAAVEAETQRYLSAGPRQHLLGRNPACAQRGKDIADGVQVARRMIGGLLFGRPRVLVSRAAKNGQL